MSPSSPRTTGAAHDRLALQIIQRRQLRSNYFDSQFFGEQGWELLLLLYAHGPEASTIESAAGALQISPSTIMALSGLLVSHGLIAQGDSPGHWSDIPIALSPAGRKKVCEYLDQLHVAGLAA